MSDAVLSTAALEAGADLGSGVALATERAVPGVYEVEGPFNDKPVGIQSPAAIEEQGRPLPCRAATLDAFVTAARALKQAEQAYRDAQQTYAEAVKAMSEEAVR